MSTAMRFRIALCVAIGCLIGLASIARPSDAQIIKDLSKDGALKVVLSPGPPDNDARPPRPATRSACAPVERSERRAIRAFHQGVSANG